MQGYRNLTTKQKRKVSIQWLVELHTQESVGGKGHVFESQTFEHEPTDDEVFQCLANRISDYNVPNAAIHADVRKVYTIIDGIKGDSRIE